MRSSMVLLVAMVACTGPEEEAGPPGIVSFTVDPASVAAGGEVTATLELENFDLTGHHEGDHDHDHDDEGHGHDDEGHGHDSHAVQRGHVHIYLDDVMTNPLLMLVEPHGSMIIPGDTSVGTHTLIARLHGDDHKIIEPEVAAEFDIEVLAPDL